MRLRKALLVSLLALALPVAAASLAYACTALATLSVSSGVAPGQTINGTGRAFNGGGHGTPAGTTPVELRWNSRTGPLMTTASPLNAAGDITFSFPAPNVPPGSYVLIAVQTNPANGTPFYGTPARQSVTIVAGSPRADRGDEASLAPAAEPQVATGASSAASASAAGTATAQPAAPSAAGSTAAGPTGRSAPAAAATERSATAAPAAPVVDAAQAVAAVDSAAATASPPAPAAPAPDVATTVTRALTAVSASDGRSPVAALLLMALGLGLVLVVSGRWLTGRLPGSR